MPVPVKAELTDEVFGALREYGVRHNFANLGDALEDMIRKSYALDTILWAAKGSELLIERGGMIYYLNGI